MTTTSRSQPVTPETGARVLVVDDQGLFRKGLSRILNQDGRVTVVGEAANGAEAVTQVLALKPDVVLMDLKMPDMDGIEATRQILAASPDTRVLILTTFEVDSYIVGALQAGATGYILKDSEPEEIVASIRTARAGGQVMAGPIGNRVVGMLARAPESADFYDGLTLREVEILKLMASGKANKQIAYTLKISEKTVRNHISHLFDKLGIYDRAQAAIYAVRKGLIEI